MAGATAASRRCDRPRRCGRSSRRASRFASPTCCRNPPPSAARDGRICYILGHGRPHHAQGPRRNSRARPDPVRSRPFLHPDAGVAGRRRHQDRSARRRARPHRALRQAWRGRVVLPAAELKQEGRDAESKGAARARDVRGPSSRRRTSSSRTWAPARWSASASATSR